MIESLCNFLTTPQAVYLTLVKDFVFYSPKFICDMKLRSCALGFWDGAAEKCFQRLLFCDMIYPDTLI